MPVSDAELMRRIFRVVDAARTARRSRVRARTATAGTARAHRVAGDAEHLAAVAHEQRVRGDQRRLEAQFDGEAAAGFGADVDGAGECAQARRHHVEADAAAGDLGDRVARGEAGQQREARDLGVAGRGVGGQQAAFHGLGCGCRARLRPRPSSATCTVTTWPRRATVSVMVPARGLPAASRSSGDSRPWSTALRRMCSSGSINWFSTSASTRMSLADDHERSLFVGRRGRLAHVALQARHDGLHRRHARLRSQMLQLAHEALLLVQDAREAGEFVLESERPGRARRWSLRSARA